MDVRSLKSTSTFKTPNLVVTDFKFTPDSTVEPFIISGPNEVDVRNIHEIDWEALKYFQKKEWSEVC